MDGADRQSRRVDDVVFLDNGLSRTGEHSLQLLKAVGEALARRGIPATIYGCRRMSPIIVETLKAKPHFRDRLYDGRLPPIRELLGELPSTLKRITESKPVFSERRTADVLNRRFAEDLAALPADIWTGGKIIVFPAISQNQLDGLIDHLEHVSISAATTIVCQLMFNVDWTPWGEQGALGPELYGRAFARLARRSGHVRLTTENEAMAEHYRQRFAVELTLLPVPLAVPHARRSRVGRVRIGFLGYSKTEKGFHLLPRAIELCRKRHPDTEFVVQVQHSKWEAATIEAERQLRRLDGITLIDGELGPEAYEKLAQSIDVVLLPYDPLRFGPRGSGIFTEAVAAGRPVVAAEGLAAAQAVATGQASGEVFAPYTSEALAAALSRVLGRLDACLEEGAILADAFARSHNGDAYVEVLLGLAASDACVSKQTRPPI